MTKFAFITEAGMVNRNKQQQQKNQVEQQTMQQEELKNDKSA